MPMREQREAKRGLGLRGRLILVLIAAAALTAAFLLGGILSRRETEPVITSELLGQQLADIQELSTVEYHYTNMGRFEDQVDFYGWKVPFTTKSFIVAYDGTIKAGTDLSGMDIQVSGDRISVTLPAPEILSHEIDEDSIQVYDQTHNIFNQIEISDYTGFTADQKSGVEEKAIDNGLLTAAKERSEAAVEHLLSRVPGVEGHAVSVTTESAAV